MVNDVINDLEIIADEANNIIILKDLIQNFNLETIDKYTFEELNSVEISRTNFSYEFNAGYVRISYDDNYTSNLITKIFG